MVVDRLWLPVPLYAKILKISTDSAYRDIRRGTCPFPTEVISGRIHVNARAMGLTVEPTVKDETREQEEVLQAAA
jgi:hypothetical protein